MDNSVKDRDVKNVNVVLDHVKKSDENVAKASSINSSEDECIFTYNRCRYRFINGEVIEEEY